MLPGSQEKHKSAQVKKLIAKLSLCSIQLQISASYFLALVMCVMAPAELLIMAPVLGYIFSQAAG